MRRFLRWVGYGVLEIVAFVFGTVLIAALFGVFGLPVAVGTWAFFLLAIGAVGWIGRRPIL